MTAVFKKEFTNNNTIPGPISNKAEHRNNRCQFVFVNAAEATGILISSLSNKRIALASVQSTSLSVFEQDQN